MAINTQKLKASKEISNSGKSLFEGWQFKKPISDKERKFFTGQLALLLETGTSMQLSLQALKKQLVNPAMVTMVDQLLTDIEDGRQFSTALGRHPKVFSSTYVNLIAASEDGGFMHEVLEQLLIMDEKREKLRQTVSSAISYPVFLLVFALSVVLPFRAAALGSIPRALSFLYRWVRSMPTASANLPTLPPVSRNL